MFKKFGGEISNNIRQYEKPGTDICHGKLQYDYRGEEGMIMEIWKFL